MRYLPHTDEEIAAMLKWSEPRASTISFPLSPRPAAETGE